MSPDGVAGWLEKSLQSEEKAKDLKLKMLAGDKKLLKLVKREERQLARTERE